MSPEMWVKEFMNGNWSYLVVACYIYLVVAVVVEADDPVRAYGPWKGNRHKRLYQAWR